MQDEEDDDDDKELDKIRGAALELLFYLVLGISFLIWVIVT